MEQELDYCVLMNGIEELDFQGNVVPSDLVLIGRHAFPLSMNPRGQVLMAASRYGQGRIIVLGHEMYLTSFPSLVENALTWLMPTESKSKTVGIQKSLRSLAINLSSSSIKTEEGDFKNVGLAVYVTDAYSVNSRAKELVAFLKSGGGLLIAGQAWTWAQTHPGENTLLCFPGNRVCSVAGIYFSAIPGEVGKFPVTRQIPSSWLAVSTGKDFKDDLKFLLQGVSGFDVRGESLASDVMAHGPLAFPIAITPCGEAFIAGAYYGQGRIIVVTHEGYLGRDSLSIFLINALRWLDEGRNGIIGIVPQLHYAQCVLSKSGLNCQVTEFMEDLSVFVCTSYDDSQCHQIQEFVAEGGGLMIGGHAWYWAQCNPNCNVMTDCPGNHILNEMGLCLMSNIIHGGLYKAQQVTKDGDSGPLAYHFRDLMRRFVKHVIQGQYLTNHEQECLQKLILRCGKDFKDDLKFLLQGVSEFDVRGESLASEVVAHGPLAFPIALAPCRKSFIAGAYYEQGRIIVVTHEGYLSRDSLSSFLINALRWLDAGRNGVIGIIPQLQCAHHVLSKSGLNCQVTGFKKDLSVFVCTSYDDSLCRQIQEFVADGGGLMIGGHAWYWAQCNPNCNVMMDCPGNRILNQMGLCLKANIIRGGLYKAQQKMEDVDICKQAYCFRDLMRRLASHVILGQDLTKHEQECLQKLIFTIGIDFKDDLRFLLKGISEFDVRGESLASEVMEHGPLAFPIALTPCGKAFIAGAYYGQGRIIVVTHEGYLGRDSLSSFLINALCWLDEGRNGVIGIVPELHYAYDVLSKSGLNCQVTGFMEDLSVFVCTSYDDSQRHQIQEFVAEGGGLMIGGHAWYWAQCNPNHNVMTDCPGNSILTKMGLCLNANIISGGLYKAQQIPEDGDNGTPVYHFRVLIRNFVRHVIQGQYLTKHEQECLQKLVIRIGNDFKDDLKCLLQGVSEFDVQGESLASEVVAHGPLSFPIALAPCRKAFIAGAYYGQGRIIMVTHESYLSRDSLSGFLINALHWLNEGRNGVIGIIPELHYAYDILSKSGLNCQVTEFMEDLSVFVCTSYDDSQCHQIQEFVAEGGGLMIGGHAWYWAQCNPNRNVMTDCPGNHILNKMGLRLKANIIRGGLYKVQQIMKDGDSSTQAYQFRDLMRRFASHVILGQDLNKHEKECLQKLILKIGFDFKDDLQFLLQGVSEFDVRGESLASEVIAHGPLAFPIALTPRGKAFIAGAYYGQGRIIVVTHEGYLGRDSLSIFLINALRWLDEGRNGVIGIIPELHYAHDVLSKSGLNCQVTGFMEDLSVFVCSSYDDSQRHQIQEFVAEGGGLMIGGHAWYWAQCNPNRNVVRDCPGNRILNQMGLCLKENIISGDLYKAQQIIDDDGIYSRTPAYHFRDLIRHFVRHVIQGQDLTKQEEECLQKLILRIGKDFKDDLKFLLQGVSEFDIRGESLASEVMASGPLAFPIALASCRKAFIAGADYGKGRIIVVTHESYLSRDSLSSFLINALHWLNEGRNGVIGIIPQLQCAHHVLSKSGLNCQVTRFRKDLSVFVCTSYDDSLRHQIQEFVAEGGGLMIGGHAWYWAQCNPNHNVMTDCPGNRILNQMGLYLKANIIRGGMYKTQQIMEHVDSSTEAYHFRYLMRRFASHVILSQDLTQHEQQCLQQLIFRIGIDFKDDLKYLLQCVSEFDVRGESLASEVIACGPLAFPIALTPCGKAFIAGAYYGQGRIIVVTHEVYLGRDSLSSFLINALRWLDEGRNGVIGIIPKLHYAYDILSKSGLNCQVTEFMEDLSVFVCTSYDDSQRHQIQEFVAEGGGLMIGGHAWYWAQCNPNRNVMMDCPGNRILTKMGLCLKAKIINGGLYKAQQKIQDRKSDTPPYHFRDLMRRFASYVIQGQYLTEHEQECLQKLRSDCTNYLRMQAYKSASYTSMVALITDMVKRAGVPQVCLTCPVQSNKDKILLDVGSELYRVCKDPDALLPFIINDIPNLPTVSKARIRISADTSECEEWISTGLYLSPGMKSDVAVPQEIKGKGWQLQIGCQTDDLGEADILKRAPVVHMRFALDSEKLQVWNLWGGLIYLIAPPKCKVNGVEVVLQTAIKAPYYKSGQTSVADWVKGIRNATAPWAELEFENVIITLHSDFIRKLDRPDEVAAVWDSIMKGVADLAAKPAKFPRKERFVADVQISAGYMHSGYPIMIHSTSVPELLNPKAARTQDIWGAIHELGHNQQCSPWEFPPHTTECTCNLWSVYVHEEVLGVNRAKAHPDMTPEKRKSRAKNYAKGGRNLDTWSVWTALETYMQLQDKFGWDAFKKVFAAYQNMKNVPNNRDEKMNLYAETFSKAVNTNLAPFFKAWGWPIQPSTEETLKKLPKWSDHPMSQYA